MSRYVIRILSHELLKPKKDGYAEFSARSQLLRIRPKATFLAQGLSFNHSTVFSVIYYDDNENAKCLFLFVYCKSASGKDYMIITRAIGKRPVKKHWKLVKTYLEENQDKILENFFFDSERDYVFY